MMMCHNKNGISSIFAVLIFSLISSLIILSPNDTGAKRIISIPEDKFDIWLKDRLEIAGPEEKIRVSIWLAGVEAESKEKSKQITVRYEGVEEIGGRIFIKKGANISHAVLNEISKERDNILSKFVAKQKQPVKDLINSIGGTILNELGDAPVMATNLTQEQILEVALTRSEIEIDLRKVFS